MATKKRRVTKTKPEIVGSDDHAPYHHEGRLDFYASLAKKYGVNRMTHAGDIFDFHAMSRFQTEVDAPNAEEEYKLALKFTKALGKIFPKGDLVLGNHDIIPQRQMKTLGLITALMKHPREILGLPKGWNVHHLYHVIPKHEVLVEHGRTSGGMYGCVNTAKKKRTSFIQGHIHAHAMYKPLTNHRDTIFGMNVGCGCDDSSLAMRYGVHNADKGVLACGIVHSGSQAELVLMEG